MPGKATVARILLRHLDDLVGLVETEGIGAAELQLEPILAPVVVVILVGVATCFPGIPADFEVGSKSSALCRIWIRISSIQPQFIPFLSDDDDDDGGRCM